MTLFIYCLLLISTAVLGENDDDYSECNEGISVTYTQNSKKEILRQEIIEVDKIKC